VYGSTSANVCIHSPQFTPSGDAQLSISGGPTFSATLDSAGQATFALNSLGAGAYRYTVSYGVHGIFASCTATGTMTIAPAPLVVTVADCSRGYGAANPGFSVRYSGFVLGENEAVLGGVLTFETTATPGSDVGSYAVNAGGLSADNYETQYVPGKLFVTPAPLAVSVNDETKVYGAPNPPFTINYDGFKLGQNATVLRGTLEISTTATDESAPGNYDVTPSGLTSSNYKITVAPGTLHVLAATARVEVDPNHPDAETLEIGGGMGSDQIVVAPGTLPGTLAVTINGIVQDNIAAPAGTTFSSIRVYGGAGDDDIQIAGAVPVPTVLFGGSGNDRLKGGNAGATLIGGDGDDLLLGGNGRDLLIGGAGADRLVGNASDDILIAGRTKYDIDLADLAVIMAEWNSTNDYVTRTQHLMGLGGGLNSVNGRGIFLLSGSTLADATVFDDNCVDTLTGSAGQDWFWANLQGDGVHDKITDLGAHESADDLKIVQP
jgi:Ca2+-binding RTX toxin-like protein